MNWSAQANQSEVLEYFIMLFGLGMISLIAGGGKASIDGLLTNEEKFTSLHLFNP